MMCPVRMCHELTQTWLEFPMQREKWQKVRPYQQTPGFAIHFIPKSTNSKKQFKQAGGCFQLEKGILTTCEDQRKLGCVVVREQGALNGKETRKFKKYQKLVNVEPSCMSELVGVVMQT